MATSAAETKSAAPAAPAKRDFRQEVTDRIVNMLEEGVAPWQKPWNPGEASVGMPINPTTERRYRGGNALHLMATGLQRGYGDPRWMTYKQAADQGWQVRRGEKGTQIEFWDVKRTDARKSRGRMPEKGAATVTTTGAELALSTACTPSSTRIRSKEFPVRTQASDAI